MALEHALRDIFGARVWEHEPLAHHTNFRIGGPARYYVDARTPEEVAAAVDAAHAAGVPWFVLGGGSNTLVADAGFPGLVVQAAMRAVRVEGSRITAGAGAITAAVARAAGDAGLAGFAWAVSLPGTIGGAVRGNAGCFGGEMKDVVELVRVLRVDGGQGMADSVEHSACHFRYRHSYFKAHPHVIILEVMLALQQGDAAELGAQMDAFLERRKVKQPLERPSAGCLFTNVECGALNAEQIERLDRETDGVWRTVAHDEQIPTGWLVQQAECSGLRVGNAIISEKHGNFVINLGGATAADVLALSAEVQRRVADRFGIAIHEEVQRLGC